MSSLNEFFHRLVEFIICRDTGLVEVEIPVAEGLGTEESKLKDDGFDSEAAEFLVHALDHTCELNQLDSRGTTSDLTLESKFRRAVRARACLTLPSSLRPNED